MSNVYRVSVWKNRATELVYDENYVNKEIAFRSFQRQVAPLIREEGVSVDLSRQRADGGGTTLAVKYTDSHRVEILPAFYGKN